MTFHEFLKTEIEEIQKQIEKDQKAIGVEHFTKYSKIHEIASRLKSNSMYCQTIMQIIMAYNLDPSQENMDLTFSDCAENFNENYDYDLSLRIMDLYHRCPPIE